jgi:hypothetical protein
VVADGSGEVLAAQVAGQVAFTWAGPGMSSYGPNVGTLERDVVELMRVDRLSRATRIVEEDDLSLVPFRAQGAEHRHDRRNPTPAADEQEPFGPPVGEDEVALGLREPEDHAGPRVRAEVLRHGPLPMGGDRELEETVGVFGWGGRVQTGVPDAVDLDGDAHVLTGSKAAPRTRRAELQRDTVWRQVADARHLAAHHVDRRVRV